PGPLPPALRYHCARLVGDGHFPTVSSGTHRSWLGFGYQEAAQEDAEAQASQDAEEDPLAAPRARLGEFFPQRRSFAERAQAVGQTLLDQSASNRLAYAPAGFGALKTRSSS